MEEFRISLDAIPTPQDVLTLADICFEMYSLEELELERNVRREISRCYPGVRTTQVRRAIALARSWKRQLSRAGRFLQ